MPLRDDLYKRLVDRFVNVETARDDEDMECYFELDPDPDWKGRPRRKLMITESGEAYRINCPFCNDTRQRLWINHMWAFEDPEARDVSYFFLVNCFNEGCLKETGRKHEFWKMVYDDIGYAQRPPLDLPKPGVRVSLEMPIGDLPGRLAHLDELGPDHPACRYLRERRFDPVDLYHHFRVCYCLQAKPEYPLVTGRIVAPFYMRGRFVGWQARLINQPASKYIPKYYLLPHMQKRGVLYNLDNAVRNTSYVAIHEGITDVWRTRQSVAIMGLKLSGTQGTILLNVWQDGIIFCALDGEAIKENQAMYDQLSQTHPRVVKVDLPRGVDPADGTADYFWALAAQAAAARGISFRP